MPAQVLYLPILQPPLRIYKDDNNEKITLSLLLLALPIAVLA